MTGADGLAFSAHALRSAPLRSALLLLAMAIGVAAVVLLTSLGEAARRYVSGEFSSLGSHLVIVLPGRNETTGGAPPLFGSAANDLTIDDALALTRSRWVVRIAPLNVGTSDVSHGALEREGTILGTSHDFLGIRHFEMAAGRFLPPGDPRDRQPICVIGETIRQELFPGEKAVGNWLRIGDTRFRVIGVVDDIGMSMGLDSGNMVIIPVANAQALFNTESLFRILIEARSREAIPKVKAFTADTIRERHDGEEDVTLITQDALLQTFDKIFNALTLTVGGIAAVSLLVAGVLIMNVMLVTVSQRTSEIGLLKAIGASRGQIVRLFLSEAVLLSLIGATIGLGLGLGGAHLLGRLYPTLDFSAPGWAVVAALLVALGSGVVFGVAPARRASRLDPVAALARH